MADVLALAREAYGRFQWGDAYRHYREVAEAEPLGAEDLAALADAAWWLGYTDESLSLSEEVYRHHLHGENVPRAARLAIEIGFLWLLRGQPTVGSGWVSRARRMLGDAPECAAHGYLRYLEVEEALGAGHFDKAIELSRWLQGLADRCGDPTLGAVGMVLEGGAEVRRGNVEPGLALIDEAMLPVRAGEVLPNWAGNLYCHVMDLCFELSDIRRARAWTEATERWCDQHSNAAMFVGICRVHRAQLLHLEGAWDAARQHAARTCHDLADMNVGVVAEGHYRIAELHRLRDEHGAAEEEFARAHELGRDPQPGLALLRLAQGKGEAAATALRTALAAAVRPLDRVPFLAAQVEVAAAGGRAEDAVRAADELARIADTFNTPGLVASAGAAAGIAALAGGEPTGALPLLRDAARRWRELNARHNAARMRARVAEALAAAGDTEAAAREAEAARVVFTELGAAHDVRALDRALGAAAPAEAPAATGVAFRVLGLLEVVRDDGPVHIGSRMQRRLLTLLLVHAGDPVPADRAIDVLWDGDPPRSAPAGLQTYVSRLRRQVSDGVQIEQDANRYRLCLDAQQLDAWRFERLVAAAREHLADDPAQAAAELAEALALWRGPAYAEFADEDFVRPEAVRLDELRLAATEDAFAARLAGDQAGLVADLEAFVTGHPLRERPHAQLMTALSRAGRVGEALEVFRTLRDRLADELGLEASAALVQLQTDILQQVPEVTPTRRR